MAVADLVRWRHNALRMWTVEHTLYGVGQTGAKNVMTPMPFERTGPGLAQDGLLKFDLSRPSVVYMHRLRARVEYLNERGIYAIVMLFQGVSYDTDIGPEYNTWKTLVYNPANNIQGYLLRGWRRRVDRGLWVVVSGAPEEEQQEQAER